MEKLAERESFLLSDMVELPDALDGLCSREPRWMDRLQTTRKDIFTLDFRNLLGRREGTLTIISLLYPALPFINTRKLIHRKS